MTRTRSAPSSRPTTFTLGDALRWRPHGRALIGPGLATLAAAALTTAALAESHAASDETVIVTHAYSNFGTPIYPADFAHLDYVNPDAPKGGEISLWTQSVFDSFNPYTRKGVEESTARDLIPEDILSSTADDPYSAYCYLCTTMEYPASRDWVIFNLRDDVTFSDGRPMTAKDIKFSFDLVLEQGISEYVNVVNSYVESVEILDTHRIKFTFTDAAPRNETVLFAGGTNAFSQSWFEETSSRLDDTYPRPFLGTGPYVIDEDAIDMGRTVSYVKDPDWWGADHPLNVGRWNFDRIRVEVFADSAAAMEGFKAGVYTFRNENSSKEWATSYDFPAIDKGWVNKEELPNGSIGSAQGFVFNLRADKWQDPRVRDAAAMMLNFEWANETLFYGLYERPASFWQNTEMMAAGVPPADEVAILQPLVDEGLFDAAILTDEARMPFVNAAAVNTPNRGSRRAASKLLDEAGWEIGSDGFRVKDGQRLTMTILQTSPAFDRIVNPFVENLRAVGFDAKLDRVDIAQYIERRRRGDWDLVNHTLTQGYEPQSTGLKQWFHSDTAEDSSRNLMALTHPGIDRLIEGFAGAETLEEVQLRARVLDRALRAEGFWLPQWFKDVHTVAYWDQYDYPEPLPPLALGATSFWWYDSEAAAALKSAGAL